ncbi:predicted protein [Chaetomium globosum CBS 148.51]|uniref:Protein kinase domain-containing protein n=1 Tax=Chaetomium globosum (strain ATCC 6205 / CBS 148.51 / DSM 1962 / NBRC 6347 / NRRL 1970) TaxID=306901 RepID=Q2H7G5_CHAGB|nr:uncharacterized protein CHGG_05400 [Chaetomium globosum CBS 148.51]EAQ88781.1 predicted protein [Chaetomium globosum CBS 148.51]
MAFTTARLATLSPSALFKIIGAPNTEKLVRLDGKPLAPGMPEQLVEKTEWEDWIDEDEEDVRLIDFGEAFPHSAPPTKLAEPGGLQAPEGIFTGKFDYRVDLWRAGCTSKLEGKFTRHATDPSLRPLLAIIKGLMRFRPQDRISADDALVLLDGPEPSKKPEPEPKAKGDNKAKGNLNAAEGGTSEEEGELNVGGNVDAEEGTDIENHTNSKSNSNSNNDNDGNSADGEANNKDNKGRDCEEVENIEPLSVLSNSTSWMNNRGILEIFPRTEQYNTTLAPRCRIRAIVSYSSSHGIPADAQPCPQRGIPSGFGIPQLMGPTPTPKDSSTPQNRQP